MDTIRSTCQDTALQPVVRNAFHALVAAMSVMVFTSCAVTWVLHTYGYSSALIDTTVEAARWFVPMFAYLWGMFEMIDAGAGYR